MASSGSLGEPGSDRSRPGPSYQPGKRLQQTQAQVDEVVGIMRVNVEKVMQRDEKISDLSERADSLKHGTQQFSNVASRIRRKYCWQNAKMMIIIGVIVAVIILIIIVSVVSSNKGSGGNPAPPPVTAATPQH